MAFKRLGEPKTIQSVVEWRYPKAHRYWDDCGKLVVAIEAALPGLVCQKLGDNGFEFQGRSGGIDSAAFGWERASVTQVAQGDGGLASTAEKYWTTVSVGLSIANPANRVGHRTWFLFETESHREAQKRLAAFATPWALGPSAAQWGTPLAGGSVVRTSIEPNGRHMRLYVDSGTMNVRNKVHHGVIVDVDIVAESPREVPRDIAEFVRSNIGLMRESIVASFRL